MRNYKGDLSDYDPKLVKKYLEGYKKAQSERDLHPRFWNVVKLHVNREEIRKR